MILIKAKERLKEGSSVSVSNATVALKRERLTMDMRQSKKVTVNY